MTICPECGFDLGLEGACPVCESGTTRIPDGKPHRIKAASVLRFLSTLVLLVALIGVSLAVYLAIPAPGDAIVRTTPAAAGIGPRRISTTVTAESDRSTMAQSIPGDASFQERRLSAAKRHDPDWEETRALLAAPVAKHKPPLDSRDAYLAWMLANTKEVAPQLEKKWERSRELLARDEVRSKAVLEAFLYTPREFFARSYNAKKAYDDTAIPIGHGQTISGPHMVSHMTDSISPLPNDRILEIGTGSGYQSALLSELSDEVYTIEIVPGLQAETEAIYRKLEKDYPEYRNISRRNADGYFGWPEHAPFHKIIVTAGIDHIPPPLLAQLAPDGVMVIPVGPPTGQTVLKIVKKALPGGGFSFERSDIYHGRKVIFVPFTSHGGKAHSLDDAKGQQ
jgi:protein-L-isoaspartate(D-aspartate) O-methyltransferase